MAKLKMINAKINPNLMEAVRQVASATKASDGTQETMSSLIVKGLMGNSTIVKKFAELERKNPSVKTSTVAKKAAPKKAAKKAVKKVAVKKVAKKSPVKKAAPKKSTKPYVAAGKALVKEKLASKKTAKKAAPKKATKGKTVAKKAAKKNHPSIVDSIFG